MNLRIASVVALVALALAACSSEEAPETDDFDWDAFFADDRDAGNEPDEDTSEPRDTSRPDRDTGGEEDTSLPPGQDGEPCETQDDCIGAACLADPQWPAGYCTSSGCRDDDDCSGDRSACVTVDGPPLCLGTCDNDDDCRERYACVDAGDDVKVCLPDFSDFQLDGEACTSDEECVGGTCFQAPDWPSGHCTTLSCESNRDCIVGDDVQSRCLVSGDRRYCVRDCESSDACRDEYGCRPIDRRSGYCAPDVEDPVDLDDDVVYPFDIACAAPTDGTLSFEYEIAEDTTSYLVTPFASDGRAITPESIMLPSGASIDLLGANSFQLVPSLLLGFVNPVLVPATPGFANQLESGTHTMTLQSWAGEVCWYVLEESTPGTTIDLHLYLVGVPDVTAATAEEFAPLTDVFDAIAELLEPAGITIGERRWFDAPDDIASLHAIVRGDWQIDELVASSTLVGPELDDALALNVFLTRAFAWSDGSGVIGISAGLPGAAGLHGTRSSGVVMTAEYADGTDAGSAFTSIVLAHEMGHYLGLFHTTEFTFAHWDPLTDTPQCETRNPETCPDLTNLMFPLAGEDHTVITPQQASVLLANPLTRE